MMLAGCPGQYATRMRSANHRDKLGRGAAVDYLKPIFAASPAAPSSNLTVSDA